MLNVRSKEVEKREFVYVAQESCRVNNEDGQIIGVYAEILDAATAVELQYEEGISEDETVEWLKNEQTDEQEYLVDGETICIVKKMKIE